MAPTITPGPASNNRPFEIPWAVHNPSALFTMDVYVGCVVRNIKFEGPAVSVATGDSFEYEVTSRPRLTLGPLETKQFDCNFDEHMSGPDPLVSASNRVKSQYRNRPPLVEWWSDQTEVITPLYDWHPELRPPAWLEGETVRGESVPPQQRTPLFPPP